ncbi:MAG: alpha/beta fold hydrolase [Clostridia bacterium]|nr:alpha/beta fold hydrolase [Clostridia bacterium]
MNIVRNIYRDTVFKRADETEAVFYFTHKDFENLNCVEFPFLSSDGHTLQGYFYSYENPVNGRLVIFDHGMGSGHTGYMKEIEKLASHGFLVFAYDHTGCMKSGGETTGGFVQSLKDLNDAVNALRATEEYKNIDISVIGHSWGAFSTMNICALHPDISHIVALSGFISVESFLKQNLGTFYKKIYEEEAEINPVFIRYNACESLAKTEAHTLIIHSDDDKMVKCSSSFDVLQKELSHKKNIRFVKVNGKNHNPNYTFDAVEYKDDFFFEYRKAMKRNILKTNQEKHAFRNKFDWDSMTQQDEDIWNIIFETLDK